MSKNAKIENVIPSFAPEKALEVFGKLNALVVQGIERAAELQTESLRAYAELGQAQAEALAAVKGVADLPAHLEKEVELMKAVAERVSTDARAVNALNVELAGELRAVARESAEAVTAKAA